jgi:hypothetical protein
VIGEDPHGSSPISLVVLGMLVIHGSSPISLVVLGPIRSHTGLLPITENTLKVFCFSFPNDKPGLPSAMVRCLKSNLFKGHATVRVNGNVGGDRTGRNETGTHGLP